MQSCSYDHIELNFFLNGQSLHCPVTGIKGTVYPVLYGEITIASYMISEHFLILIDAF